MPLVSNFSTKLFADDAVLTLTSSCPRLLNKNVNIELVKIDEWLKLYKLSLNTSSGVGKVFNQRATSENSKLLESHKFCLRY